MDFGPYNGEWRRHFWAAGKGHFPASPKITHQLSHPSLVLIQTSEWPKLLGGGGSSGISSSAGNGLLCVDSQLNIGHRFRFYAKMGGIIEYLFGAAGL